MKPPQVATAPRATGSVESRETYTNGYDNAALAFMQRRTLATHGRFIEPFLRPGLRLLDLGCGPGNLTLDLAQRVVPHGSVVGIDRHEDQFAEARLWSSRLPVEFRAMDAYRLDLEDESFDGVFSHALFEHLSSPLDALKEAHRVLKEGGFIGLRSPDWGGVVVHPCSRELQAAFDARLDLQTRNGGNVHAGRHLGDWLWQAGFSAVTVSASYQIYDDNAFIVDHIASQLEKNGQGGHAATWKQWGENPHAMFAQAWFEATGFKETAS